MVLERSARLLFSIEAVQWGGAEIELKQPTPISIELQISNISSIASSIDQ